MSAHISRSPEAEATNAPSRDLSSSSTKTETIPTLASLPVGARLILRCRKDWRDASVAVVEPGCIILWVNSPRGRTYRVRRPPDSPLNFDGHIPLLGDGAWRASRARYDTRW